MGLRVVVVTENGEEIAGGFSDTKHLLASLLPKHTDESFVCLRFIDRYGDTVFNTIQMRPFLRELHRISERATTEEQRILLDKLSAMALMCLRENHLYLKFIGD